MPESPPTGKVSKPGPLDGFSSFPDGLNMGIDPYLLPRTQLATALNVTVRGTFAHHRPPFNQVTLSGAGGVLTAIAGGIFQGAYYYQPDSGLESLIASVSGRLYQFQMSGTTCNVTDITPSTGANPTGLIQNWMWQSEKWLITQNGQSLPWIYDNLTARQARNGITTLGLIGAGAGIATFAITGDVTVPGDGSTAAMGISGGGNFTGTNNSWVVASWVVGGIKFYQELLVVSGAGTTTINVTQFSGASVLVKGTAALIIANNSYAYPPVGSTVAVALGCSGLTSDGHYNGDYNITLQAFRVWAAGDNIDAATPGTPVPIGTWQILPDIATYQITLGVGELVSTGTMATVNHTAHGFQNNGTVLVAGASPAAYNGTYVITVVNANQFTYTFAGGGSPATGTITVSSISTGPQQNAQLLHTSGSNVGSTIPPGSAIVQATSTTQKLQFASTTAALVINASGTPSTIPLSAPYTGSNGDTVLIGPTAVTIISGAGTTTLIVNNQQAISFTYLSGTAVYGFFTVTTNQTVGVVAQQFVVPANNATVNVVLRIKYTGANANLVTINGDTYQISQFTPGPSSPQNVLLKNLDTDPTNAHLVNRADVYVYFAYLPEIPVGKMGTYANGRTWSSLADGRSYWASDLVGSSSGSPTYNFRDAVLKSVTNNFLAGGGTFSVPGSPASITAIFGTAQLDTSLGQGPVGISTSGVVYSNQAPPDRLTWQNLSFPIQTISLNSNGALSQDGTQPANGDTIYRALDGVRTLTMARKEFDVWGNVPISREVGPILATDSPALLNWHNRIIFDNRSLETANPTQHAQGIYHPIILALDFDPISSLRGKAPSVWDGPWTGLNVLRLLKGNFQGVERAFAFHLDLVNGIQLWEITKSGQNQYWDNNNPATPVTWRMESPGMMRDRDPRKKQLYRLMAGEFSIDNMVGTVTFSAYYKPDQYPNWVPWYKWSQTANPLVTPNFQPRVGLPEPSPQVYDVTTNRPTREAYGFQVALVVTGHVQIRDFAIWAEPVPEAQYAPPIKGGQTTGF